MAKFLNPSPGEIPELDGVDICGLSMPLREIVGGDLILYIDFNRRYDLEARIATAKAEARAKVEANLKLLDRRAGILVADASGHRVTDALIAAMLHQAFLLGAIYELDLNGEITTRIFEQNALARSMGFHKPSVVTCDRSILLNLVSGTLNVLQPASSRPAAYSIKLTDWTFDSRSSSFRPS